MDPKLIKIRLQQPYPQLTRSPKVVRSPGSFRGHDALLFPTVVASVTWEPKSWGSELSACHPVNRSTEIAHVKEKLQYGELRSCRSVNSNTCHTDIHLKPTQTKCTYSPGAVDHWTGPSGAYTNTVPWRALVNQLNTTIALIKRSNSQLPLLGLFVATK